MYITGKGNKKIKEFNLSTPFDLSNVNSKVGVTIFQMKLITFRNMHSVLMVLKYLF